MACSILSESCAKDKRDDGLEAFFVCLNVNISRTHRPLKSMSLHYALVSKPGCGPLHIPATPADEEFDNTYLNQDHDDNKRVRSELTGIYQYYAEMYPNPKLLEEARQRDVLLQAALAARNHQQLNNGSGSSSTSENNQSHKRSKTGFFSFLFGGGRGGDTNGSANHTTQDGDDNDEKGGLTKAEEEALLKYTDIIDDDNDGDDNDLCGTTHSIDTSCIPDEAYSVARLHLTSTRTRRDHPNALRWGAGTFDRSSNKSTSMMVVVGLGKVAVFASTCGGGNNSSDPDHEGSRIFLTSDRDELVEYAQRTQEFALHNVRGTILSPTCIAISWGFMDGIIIFYRRIVIPPRGSGARGDEGDGFDGWEAVWMMGPSGSVLENMTDAAKDLFHDNEEQPGSPLLRISDCLVLPVETMPTPVSSAEEVTAPPQNSMVLTLSLSRLGGYIELVPLPTGLWNGPVLTPHNYRRPKRPQQKRKRGQQQPHYALGKNIASPTQTLALMTTEYQTDILCLEAFRTSVNCETIWDNQAFPNSPPAEFVLVASGASKKGLGNNDETLTFWTVSTIFPDIPVDPVQDDIGFHLHAALIEVLGISVGGDVSVFSTPDIMRRWRTPRRVDLKEPQDGEESGASQPQRRVTTLSASAPIVKIQFSDMDGSTAPHSGPFLSVLDWNGGIQIFDCSIMARVAAQNVPMHEYEQYLRHEQETFPLVTSMVGRAHFARDLGRRGMILVGNFHWVGSVGFGTNGTMPSLVLLLLETPILVVATFPLTVSEGSEMHETEASSSAMISLPFPGKGAAMQSLKDSDVAFAAIRRRGKKPYANSLKYFAMEQLQPMAIVEALARESKYEEAIQSARQLSDYEQNALSEVIARCHRRLWETKRDVDSLQETQSAAYIAQQATSLFDRESKESELPWEKVRPVLKLALASAEELRDGDRAGALRRILVRLGSFELLCKSLDSIPTLVSFREEVIGLDVVALSIEMAERGDLCALSILVFRHRREIGMELLPVLDALPLPLNPSAYCHLLPIIQNGRMSDFFLPSNEDGPNLPWSHMPQYLTDRENVSLVVDLFDEKVVLDFNKVSQGDNSSDSMNTQTLETSVANWFVARAKRIQSFLGQEGNMVSLCELGLKCVAPFVDETSVDTSSPAIQQLFKTWRSSLIFQRMLIDGVVSIDGDGISTEDLLGMSVIDLLELVLEGEMETSMILSKFRDYLQPLLFESSGSQSKANDLDKALVSYCVNETEKCNKNLSSDPELSIALTKRALASCSAISQSSKTSVHKRDRLIKEKEMLIEMVLTVVQRVSSVLGGLDLSMNDYRELRNLMWNMYESLPADSSKTEPMHSSLVQKLETLYQMLVCFDACSRWPGLDVSLCIDPKREGEDVCVEVCKSFCAIVGRIPSGEDKISSLKDLLSDLTNLNDVCFRGRIEVGRILSSHLVPSLLEKGAFDLLAVFLASGGALVDQEGTEKSVLDFVDEAVFATGSNVTAAIKCQEVVGPKLPKLKATFESIRRYLHASHFIATVIFDGTDARALNPSELKNMSPFDAVEVVMRMVPQSVICGCPQWMDEAFAREANKALREAESPSGSVEEPSPQDGLPILPGGAIFHLATILGLDESMAVLAVKCRVIHYALECEFFGTAAAIARTFVLASASGRTSDTTQAAADNAKLSAVAQIVSIETYTDLRTKKELCEAVLCRCNTCLLGSMSAPFDTILEVSSSLNVVTSRFNIEFQDFPAGRRERLLSRPLARLPKHILHDYKAHVYRLFTDLTLQAEQGQVHDDLMKALSMFHFYWCLHDAKSLKARIDMTDKADAEENLALSCALALQIPSNSTASNCVHTLQKTAADEISRVATEERLESDDEDVFKPNADLVRRLIGRGYSENAAVRAVTMTANSGYNEALQWAVVHTMDPDFDKPLVMLKKSNCFGIDENAILQLQKSLFRLERILEQPSERASFLHSTSRKDGQFTMAPTDFGPKNGKEAVNINGSQNLASTPSTPVFPLKSSSHMKAKQKPDPVLPKPVALPHTTATKSVPLSRPPPPPRLNGKSKASSYKGVTANDSKQSTVTSREELRRNGEALRAQLRGQKSKTDSRRRLIDDGRRLFQQTRQTPKAAATTLAVDTNGHQAAPKAVPPRPPLPQQLQAGGTNGIVAPAAAASARKPALAAMVSQHLSAKVAEDVNDVAGAGGDDWDFDDFDDM